VTRALTLGHDRLPEYTVRVSGRARRIRLTVTPHEGLVVVVPPAYAGEAAAIVAEKREWAERALARVAERRSQLLAEPEAMMPTRIELPMSGEVYPVRLTDSDRAAARVIAGELVASGPEAESRLRGVRSWLDRRARDLLGDRVSKRAAAHGVRVARVRVTKARTRWGSCSARGTISVNRNVVFFSPELADALIDHELAHLGVMNHSRRFWDHLAGYDPEFARHRVELRDAASRVPAWADE
jgi:predicted metal-dependent hydrolase